MKRSFIFTLLMLMLQMLSASAIGDDIITFEGGAPDPDNPDIYVIDKGNAPADQDVFTITVVRPQGATATHEASISLKLLGTIETKVLKVTFAPGETRKTVEVNTLCESDTRTWSGKVPGLLSVMSTSYADTAYKLLRINVNRQNTEEPEQSNIVSQLEMLNNMSITDFAVNLMSYWGEYAVFRIKMNSHVKITDETRVILNVPYLDHTGLPFDADDFGMAKTRQVVLTPINAGSVTNQIWCLYHPQDDEYFYSFGDNATENQKTIEYQLIELGPLEVVNPAEGAVKYLFYSRTDLPEYSSHLDLSVLTEGFKPKFSDVSINKTTFKSGETMIITAKMDNWNVVKRGQGYEFMSSFGVSLDDFQTMQPNRSSFDEETGTVKFFVTAPDVSANSKVNVSLGTKEPVAFYSEDYDMWESEYVMNRGSKGNFAVSVLAADATEVPATQLEFQSLPPDGSLIVVNEPEMWSFTWVEYPLVVSAKPDNATHINNVTYTVTNSDGANAEIKDGILYLKTNPGTTTITATLPNGVSTSRTFYLWSSFPKGLNNVNTYYLGTQFPKFQFQIENKNGWAAAVNDKVSVKYTHMNGTQWTEEYEFSKLTRHKGTNGNYYYDLPFTFSDEHPEVTDFSQLGQTVITAEVTFDMPSPDNKVITVEATSELVNDLRKPSFSDYSNFEAYYNDIRTPELTSEVMYLPRKGFTVGYEIPELNIKESYNNKSGQEIPEWLEIIESEDDEYYCTANITVHPDLTATDYDINLYTFVQRTCNPDEAMEYFHTCHTKFLNADAEGHLKYVVNGAYRDGDMTFNNETALNAIYKEIKQNNYATDESIEDASVACLAKFYMAEDCFNGAEITLSCEGDVIQTLNNFNGSFYFLPPADSRTYEVEVYFPGYGKRYKNTFVRHPIKNIYGICFNKNQVNNFSYYRDGIEKVCRVYGNSYTKYIYAEKPIDLYVRSYTGNKMTRINNPEWFVPIDLDVKAELTHITDYYVQFLSLNNFDVFNYYTDFVEYRRSPLLSINWDEIKSQVSVIKVVNTEGEPINNATLNFACVDNTMKKTDVEGSAVYTVAYNGYPIQTDCEQFAELIEVIADGYQPTLATMNLWNYDYTSRENRGKTRYHTIVLQKNDKQVNAASLETLTCDGNIKNDNVDAKLSTVDLITLSSSETLNYSESADYESVTKNVKDEKFGTDGWSGTNYAHLIGYMPYDNGTDPTLLQLMNEDGSLLATPTTKIFTKTEFTTFSKNYCMFDFDLVGSINQGTTVHPSLKIGTQTIAELPSLHNETMDLMALSEANDVSLPNNITNLNNVDNDIKNQGVDVKDMNKAFDKFNFQMPDVLPFTVNIERNGDYFLVRAACELNILPSGPVMNALDKLDNLRYFDEQYQACMDAVNIAGPMDDDFFDDIPRLPSAFVGVRGFLSGIGTYNSQTKQIDINFYDGGLTFEASAGASANVRFGIGGFGLSIDAKIASTMALVNRAAALGDVAALPRIDFVIDNECRLKLCAWAYAGIDIWIAKARVGVRGGASIDVRTRSIMPTYGGYHSSGTKTSLEAYMQAFAELRILWWKKKKSWNLFKAQKTYLSPNNKSNPFHPSFPQPVFSVSRQNVTKSYKKLRRKAIADLGTPIISNVSGMARPAYLKGGNELVFNNLKTASNYNDDCLQIFNNGNKSDLTNNGNKPMYDFSVARNGNTEAIAFEQVNSSIDEDELETMTEEQQTSLISERTEINVAVRKDGNDWTTATIGTNYQNGCVTPAVAVQSNGHAAVVYQQGLAKYNEDGDRYIEGSLMLARYDGTQWGEPIEIKRLNRRNVPADYQMTMKDDSVLVMMTLKQDINNTEKQASLVYVSVSPDDKVRELFTMVEGSKPQIVNVNGANLVGYIQNKENGRDIVLNTVNMRGKPTFKLSGNLGMENNMVNDFRLIVDDDAVDLDGVSLLWSQNDQEATTDEEGTTTVVFKNRIYTSKLCCQDHTLYFSAPIEVATMPDDVSLASLDGWLDGLDMKVAYSVTNEEDGAAVLENHVEFTNAIDHKVAYNAYEITDEQNIPVTVTVANNGFSPIESIDVQMGDSTYTHKVNIMPQKTVTFTDNYPVTDSFDGTIDYNVTATFTPANSNSLKLRRHAAARPHRVAQSGTRTGVRQVDMALKVLSKSIDENGLTTVVAEVNNASLLPISSGTTCKIGLYAAPMAAETAEGTSTATVSYADLYDNSLKKNKVKIVTLTAQASTLTSTLFLRTTPMESGTALNDINPANNVIPVNIKMIEPEVPTEVQKLDVDVTNRDVWTTVDGVRMMQVPTRRGVYIHNDKKVVVK
ncbi:MAG: hypothetical protein K5893_04690 [Prevotella sp.]|nr:hypothetical protein [Prevotella sp.]